MNKEKCMWTVGADQHIHWQLCRLESVGCQSKSMCRLNSPSSAISMSVNNCLREIISLYKLIIII